jgi:hypothetical protein
MKRQIARVLSVAALTIPLGLSSGVASAEPIGGTLTDRSWLDGQDRQSITLTCRGGEQTRVCVRGDGSTDLDLYVFDDSGRLLGSDTGSGDHCHVNFRPDWTGRVTLRIVNLGWMSNRYTVKAD